MSTISGTAVSWGQPPSLFTTAVRQFTHSGSAAGEQAKPRVLVIDEESAICDLLTLYLSNKGLEVATVRSAREARGVVERGEFDLVLLDWMLEGAEGLDLFHLCKLQHPDIPVVIFTSAEPDEISLADSVARQAEAVVRKGGPLNALATAILRSLDQREVQPLNAA